MGSEFATLELGIRIPPDVKDNNNREDCRLTIPHAPADGSSSRRQENPDSEFTETDLNKAIAILKPDGASGPDIPRKILQTDVENVFNPTHGNIFPVSKFEERAKRPTDYKDEIIAKTNEYFDDLHKSN